MSESEGNDGGMPQAGPVQGGAPHDMTGRCILITGAGDVLEPEHDVTAIGSGGNFALAAARALMDSDLSAEEIARRAMAIAADICVYTNGNLTVETIATGQGRPA